MSNSIFLLVYMFSHAGRQGTGNTYVVIEGNERFIQAKDIERYREQVRQTNGFDDVIVLNIMYVGQKDA